MIMATHRRCSTEDHVGTGWLAPQAGIALGGCEVAWKATDRYIDAQPRIKYWIEQVVDQRAQTISAGPGFPVRFDERLQLRREPLTGGDRLRESFEVRFDVASGEAVTFSVKPDLACSGQEQSSNDFVAEVTAVELALES